MSLRCETQVIFYPFIKNGFDRIKGYSSSQKYVPVELLTITISRSRRMISFRSRSCPSKLERVKENILEVFQIRKQNQTILLYSKSHSYVLFYALLCASSCRSKRNHPAAEKERYSDNNYRTVERLAHILGGCKL
jgi:hypothetical protein